MLAILNDFITNLIGDYGYLAVFFLMVLESACIPVPSEVTMLFGGALASTAFAGAGHELDLVTVALVGTAGNVVGSWLAYWAGAVGGRPLIDRFGRYVLVLPHEVDRAQEWFERWGELAVFVSRLLPVIRTFISLPAGVARMPFWRFTVYTVLGCLPWTFALAWLGLRPRRELDEGRGHPAAVGVGDRRGGPGGRRLVGRPPVSEGPRRLRRARPSRRGTGGGVGSPPC